MAPIDRLLVPMDGSPLSEQALHVALAEYPDATVTVLHVINPAQPGYSYEIDIETAVEPLHGSEEWYERSQELAEDLFERVDSIAADYDATVRTQTTIGEPGRAIIDAVHEEGFDQIVIGSHGRSESDQPFLGSVTETVVFRSPVRVLLVR